MNAAMVLIIQRAFKHEIQIRQEESGHCLQESR